MITGCAHTARLDARRTPAGASRPGAPGTGLLRCRTEGLRGGACTKPSGSEAVCQCELA